MLFLPECFNFIGNHWSETVAQAEPLDGPALARYRALARATGLWLSLGGFHESSAVPVDLARAPPMPPPPDGGAADAAGAAAAGAAAAAAAAPPAPPPGAPAGAPPTKAYNAHVVLDAAGATAAVYRKVHLFDVEIPGGAVLRESSYTAPGADALVAVDTPAGRLGLATCYDMRFPEMFAALARATRAATCSARRRRSPCRPAARTGTCCCARAVEAQCYMLAAAQAGAHNAKRRSYGHALAVDPWGDVVGDAGGDDDDDAPYGADEPPRLVLCEIDAARLRSVRERMPIQEHRDAADAATRGGGA